MRVSGVRVLGLRVGFGVLGFQGLSLFGFGLGFWATAGARPSSGAQRLGHVGQQLRTRFGVLGFRAQKPREPTSPLSTYLKVSTRFPNMI